MMGRMKDQTTMEALRQLRIHFIAGTSYRLGAIAPDLPRNARNERL